VPDARRFESDLEDWVLPVAKQVVRMHGQGWPDRSMLPEDLVWELVEHWWLKRSSFTDTGPASLRTVAELLMKNRLRDLRDAISAAKRGGGLRLLSLHTPAVADDPDGEELLDLLAAGGPLVEDQVVRQAAARQLRAFTRSLGPDEQELLRVLMEEDGAQAPTARRLGIARTTLARRLDRIRHAAEERGLRDWL
jgi:DNA-directed RNA polymerase specialized sigma24 family protein